MAKRKSKGVAVAMDMTMPSPSMYIDLQDEDLDMLKELTVGQSVTILVKGKVASISQRTSNYDGKKEKRGDFSLTDYDVELEGEGDFAGLEED